MNKIAKIGVCLLFGGLCCFFSSGLIQSFYNGILINVLIFTSISLLIVGIILIPVGLSQKPTTVRGKSVNFTSQFDQYNEFINKVYICTERNINKNKIDIVCITKDTRELFSLTSKVVDDGYARQHRILCAKPTPITSYDDLLNKIGKLSRSYYPDLNESNMNTYFDFMFRKPTYDGETLKKQLLSRDCNIIYSASIAVIHAALLPHNQRKILFQPSYDSLTQIKENTSGIQLGGMFASNNRFLTRALQIIENIDKNQCPCNLTFDSFGGSAETYADNYGFILIQPDKDVNTYVKRGIIECPLCHKKYYVTEEYTGWHIASRSTFTRIY